MLAVFTKGDGSQDAAGLPSDERAPLPISGANHVARLQQLFALRIGREQRVLGCKMPPWRVRAMLARNFLAAVSPRQH
jgi:hypothetical protein